MRLHVAASARRDIREISNAYEDEREGLGDQFVNEIKEVLTRIHEMPFSKTFPSDCKTRRSVGHKRDHGASGGDGCTANIDVPGPSEMR